MAHSPFHIQLSDGRSFPGRPDHTLLRQLQDAGCRVPVACSNGNCGRCFATLLSGVSHSHTASVASNLKKIPLCTHFADADISLRLPYAPRWRCYACEVIQYSGGVVRLRLPAGRLDLGGDQWLLRIGDQVMAIDSEHFNSKHFRSEPRSGRELTLPVVGALSIAAGAMVQVYNVDTQPDGRYQLRDGAHTLLRNLTASVAREIQNSLIQSGLSVTR